MSQPISVQDIKKVALWTKITTKIFAQFKYFLYLCNVVERQQKRAFKP